jgi:hypothetical protein
LEEARLHNLLRDALPGIQESDPQRIFGRLKSLVQPGMLTAAPPTPLAWRIRNLLHMLLPLMLAAACLALFPVITIALLGVGSALFAVGLRRHEQTYPIVRQP